MGTPAGRHIGESSHSAPDVQDQFAGKILRTKTSARPEGILRAFTLVGIELRSRMHVPLKTKAPGVLLLIDKTDNAVDLRIFLSAINASQPSLALFEAAMAREATKNAQNSFSDSRLVAS
jgi:hypothetical protein